MTSGSHFRKVQNFSSEYAIAEFTQYESTRTGMRVVVVDRKSTKVSGEFTLATEIHDDSGAPHTLEHLVFMGSRSYPYKGVLDKLANRSYSETNAWTDTDHTNYTLNSAGWAGFVQILPIYLEHIILPTLTDSGCYTEVHHIDGEGNDAGVVYSEMQALQNTASELIDSEAKKQLFPEGIGFRYETGGMMAPLRVLTADRIREFHKLMYQPKNLRLNIAGQVDHQELLQVLSEFENTITGEVPPVSKPFKRPWVDSETLPPLQRSVLKRVEFPEEDESTGDISICMFGPDCEDSTQVRAMNVLGEYLTGSSISLLENRLVEVEHMASSVDLYLQMRPRLVIWFGLSSVQTKNLERTEMRFWAVLEQALEEPLDMNYLRVCLGSLRKRLVYDAEMRLDAFTDDLIQDHLYSDRSGCTLERTLKSLDGYDELQEWTEEKWKDLIRENLVNAPHVTVLGVPSATLSKKLKVEEAERLIKRRKEIGADGLKVLETRLEHAKALNATPIPDDLFKAIPIPSPDSIPWIQTTTAHSGSARSQPALENDAQRLVDQDSGETPLFLHFEHTPAKCVYISLILSLDDIPVDLKPLLSLYITNFFTTPLQRNGQVVGYGDVIKQLEQDTISYTIETGAMSNAELLRIRFVIEPTKYQVAICWLRDLLFNAVFEVERLESSLLKLISDIPALKREGHEMVTAVDNMVHYMPQSSQRAQSPLVKAVYLRRIKRLLANQPEEVLSKLNNLCKSMYTFANMRVLVIGDVTTISHPVSAWSQIVDHLVATGPMRPIADQTNMYSEALRRPGIRSGVSYIVPMPTIDSSFGLFTTQGIRGFHDERLPAFLLAMSYLDATDGPLWTAVRGAGLAYGCNFVYRGETGLLKLTIYRSPDVFKAYRAARQIVTDYVDLKVEIDKFALEGAISSLVLQYANEQVTAVQAGYSGFIHPTILGIPRNFSASILRKVREVKPGAVLEAMRNLIMPVFDPEYTNMLVTCATTMRENLVQNFEKVGFSAEVESLDYFQDDYGLIVSGGDETDSESEALSDQSGESDGDDDEGDYGENEEDADEEIYE